MTSGLDKENAIADTGAVPPFVAGAKTAPKDKKSRSKSLGPGGLDALQHSNGNRRQSTASFPLKSILKPTVPVSPVRKIPTFEETRRRTPARDASSQKGNTGTQNQEGLLIDFATPPQPAASTSDDTTNPFDTFNATSAIRDEMAATKERDDKERKERERQTILEKREARRKSMANRRVSFAPEATLHTWNVVEIPDDSTSSSAANSTRRASSTPNTQQPQQSPQKEGSSSPERDAESDFGFSPVRREDLEQMRGQSASSGEAEGPTDMSSSPFSGSSVSGSEDTGAQSLVEEDAHSSESEDGFDAESTAMSIDDMTARSAATMRSDETSSSSSSAKLNEALRLAAKEAGTEAIDDENGEMTMEIADEEITGAFQPWIKKGQSFDWDDISARLDQENVNPLKDASAEVEAHSEMGDEDEELSMDVTNAIGRILGNGRRKSAVPRKSLGQETSYDDQTMEMTTMVGGIAEGHSAQPENEMEDDDNEDEEMTMEFTAAVGGLLNRGSHQTAHTVEQPAASSPKSDRMDFEQDNDSDEGMDMEMTGAVGGILPSAFQVQDKGQAKALMELESDSGQLGSSSFQNNVRKSPAKSPAKSPLTHVAAVASENGSPSLASVRSRPSRRSSIATSSTPGTPRSAIKSNSPSKKPSTPSKQLTPQQKPTTPTKTPPSANVSFRSASPKKLFQPELRHSADRRHSLRRSIFEQNAATGQSTPRIVLQPREARRSSGLGIDKEGLGSPRVAEILDRRPSLGDSTPQFVPQEHKRGGVRFEDPLKMQEDEDRDREEEELREDGHTPPQVPNGDVTSNLRDMISKLSPKKNKIGSRKSLHVGAARGILGKRPLELDLDEDSENSPDPKRLRGRDVSPVKGVKLPAPTMNENKSRRSIRSPLRRAHSSSPFKGSPLKGSTTPTQEPRGAPKTGATPLKEGIDALHIASDPQQPDPNDEDASGQDEAASDFESIQLQDFLNMTNIHFMELTTTKRRHTTAPGSAKKRLSRPSSENVAKAGTITFDDCVAAGFCTVPMLELYQHSCRELKSYISEGRQVIRSIEAETYTDNPPLFREYVTAPPDIRVIMDNQFRNVKTHARFLSKATWYEWRMKLLEGLMQGLHRHVDDMKADDELLSKREELLGTHVPPLVEKHATLEGVATNLQQSVEEMENCDQDELREIRQKLSNIEDEIEAKKRELQQLQGETEEKTNIIEAGTEIREEYMAQIQEAEKVKEECRGWSARDIRELKASVHKIERQTGWSITSASPGTDSSSVPMLTMSYRGQLQIKFHPGAFATNNSNAADKTNLPLELTFTSKKAASAIASLVLQSMQQYLPTIQQSKIASKQLLHFISTAWDRTLGLENEARMLEFCGVTRLTLSDPKNNISLRARCTLLGNGIPSTSTPSRKGAATQNKGAKRIDVDFTVRTCINTNKDATEGIGGMDFNIDVLATKVYGFGSGNKSGLPDKDMQSILGKGLDDAEAGALGNGVWCKAVQQLTGSVF
ncbi:Kinetochore Spc7 [Penicillium angulare]|uniref:Kinetochore Spc7 n=1 Tax=Penicillium angulare TaxID=116970 RepID=UPI00254041BB|nr:Kinetochore Spc7 [Penicillium angulare]KAJ5267575.1 Kinetochore Spc7 [Penicillium angulare]